MKFRVLLSSCLLLLVLGFTSPLQAADVTHPTCVVKKLDVDYFVDQFFRKWNRKARGFGGSIENPVRGANAVIDQTLIEKGYRIETLNNRIADAILAASPLSPFHFFNLFNPWKTGRLERMIAREFENGDLFFASYIHWNYSNDLLKKITVNLSLEEIKKTPRKKELGEIKIFVKNVEKNAERGLSHEDSLDTVREALAEFPRCERI